MNKNISTIIQFVLNKTLVITNAPTAGELAAIKVANSGAVAAEVEPGSWLMPVSTGSWSYPFLERISRKGIKFRVEKTKLDEEIQAHTIGLEDFNPLKVRGDAHLVWVDSEMVTKVTIMGARFTEQFDWGILGLSVKDGKKTTKRLAEVTRLVKASTARALSVQVLTPEDKSNDPEFWVKALDGKNTIRMGALPRTIQRDLDKAGHQHVMGRGWTNIPGHGATLVKGDFIVIDDSEWPWEVDVVAHSENLKNEVTLLEDRPLWTFWEHAPLHLTQWDQQTRGNYPGIFKVSSMKDDYISEFSRIREKLDAGYLPSEGVAMDDVHDDSFRLPTEEILAKKGDLAGLLRSAGMSPKVFENLVGLDILGFIKSKNRYLDKVEYLAYERPNPLFNYHLKHAVVMRNSFRATCVTDTFLKHFGGKQYTASRVAYYDPRWGMVWNGEHFARSFELHGTHDNDDTHFFVPVKLWCSDTTSVDLLKKAGVILNNITIPNRADEALMMLMVFRLPNGAGEYSIMEFDFDSWPEEIEFDESIIQTHNVSLGAGWPTPQPMLIPRNMPGLKTSRVYSKKEYTYADFCLDMEAQVMNPGFGSVCNTLLAYSDITGGKIPKCMPDSLGNIVDATQQGADIETFLQVNEILMDIEDELIEKYKGRTKGTINWYTYYRRGKQIKGAIREGSIKAVKGKIEEFDAFYGEMYRQLQADIQVKYSFFMRRDQPVNQKVLKLQFNDSEIAWAKRFVMGLESNLSDVDNARYNIPTRLGVLAQKAVDAQLSAMRRQVVDEAIETLEGLKRTNEALLCIWHTVLKPYGMNQGAKHGYRDRSLCVMGTEKSVAHMIVEAMVSSGLAS